MIKALMAAALGMMVHLPGVDPSLGQMRLTFNIENLEGGLSLLPVLIGAFAVSQIFKDIIVIDREPPRVTLDRKGMVLSFSDLKKYAVNFFPLELHRYVGWFATRDWCEYRGDVVLHDNKKCIERTREIWHRS